MAQFHTRIPVDLAMAPHAEPLPHQLALKDHQSFTLTALVYDSRAAAPSEVMAGTVTGHALRPDGATVELIGAKGAALEQVTDARGNAYLATPCTVTVPQNALTVPGRLLLSIMLSEGETVNTTVLQASLTVNRTSSDQIVDGGEVIITIDTLIGQVEDAAADAAQAKADAEAAAAAAENIVSYAPQTLTETEKSQARTNIGAVDEKALAAVFAPVEYWDADATQALSARRVKRENGYEYTVTGTGEGGVATGNVYHRLSGVLGVISTSNGMNNWTSSVELESGVPYTMTVIPLSGSIGGSGDFYLLMRDENNVNHARINLDGTMQTARFYWPDSALKGKLILRTATAVVTNDFRFRLILARDMNAIPQAPATDGTYTLRLTVTDGVPAYAWVSESAGLMSTPLMSAAPDPTDESEE